MKKGHLMSPEANEFTCENKYLKAFINNYVSAFRRHYDISFSIYIGGLGNFISNEDRELSNLLSVLNNYGFAISFVDNADSIETIQITYAKSDDHTTHKLECNIGNLISIISLASKTDIPTIGIIIVKIVSRLICQSKILYKAIVLDLDDTLWKGTLGEEGKSAIAERMRTIEGHPFISFMRFIRVMATELGIFVAICSRNNIDEVKDAIDYMDHDIFPLKGHIDYIVSNNNDKSINIKHIADKLSILPEAVVFVDDNAIVRDEVKHNVPNAFVPEWEGHDELITLLTICCAFDRYELSINSRNRKRQFSIIQSERECNALPMLYIKVRVDKQHKEASKLYAKSNQFKLTSLPISNDNAQSLVFDIYRANGEYLGLCSAITYVESNECLILNWAISCRYFEIGLEEFIIMYLWKRMNGKPTCFVYQDRDESRKVRELIDQYTGQCFTNNTTGQLNYSDNQSDNFEGAFKELLTQLKDKNEPFSIYWISDVNVLINNTHIQLYE